MLHRKVAVENRTERHNESRGALTGLKNLQAAREMYVFEKSFAEKSRLSKIVTVDLTCALGTS